MTPPATPTWQPAAAYLYILDLDAASLAWEYLRRNALYQADWRIRPRTARTRAAHRWGLYLLENPLLDARQAQPLWRLPGTDEDAAAVASGRSMRSLEPSAHQPPYRASHLVCVARQTTPANRGMAVSVRALNHMRALQALDAWVAGASHRAIAVALFGIERVTADWFADGDLRAQVRRHLARAHAYCSGEYQALARLALPASDRRESSLPATFSPADTGAKRRKRSAPSSSTQEHAAMAVDASTPALPRFLTAAEAAQFLRVSVYVLERHRAARTGPRFRRFGRMIRYAVTDLEAWAEAQAVAMGAGERPPASSPEKTKRR